VHIHRQVAQVIDDLREIRWLDLRQRERSAVLAEGLIRLVVSLLGNQSYSTRRYFGRAFVAVSVPALALAAALPPALSVQWVFAQRDAPRQM
jgi:hypothetical protein